MSESRCTGHCCRNFWLPFDPAGLRFEAKKARIGKSRYIACEVLKVEAMAIPIRPAQNTGWRYTCKHHDPVTGDCQNYAERPRMCSDYPYGKPCSYRGCTLKQPG